MCRQEDRQHPVLDLQGHHVVVTAGGTREPIDPIRFIGNRSSGKMGFALADAARERGARVTLITTVPPPRPEAYDLVQYVETAWRGCGRLSSLPANPLMFFWPCFSARSGAAWRHACKGGRRRD